MYKHRTWSWPVENTSEVMVQDSFPPFHTMVFPWAPGEQEPEGGVHSGHCVRGQNLGRALISTPDIVLSTKRGNKKEPILEQSLPETSLRTCYGASVAGGWDALHQAHSALGGPLSPLRDIFLLQWPAFGKVLETWCPLSVTPPFFLILLSC